MATFESAQVQIPQIDLREIYQRELSPLSPLETENPRSLHDRILNSSIGRTFAALVTTLGAGLAFDIAPSTAASQPTVRPTQLLNRVLNYYDTSFVDGSNAADGSMSGNNIQTVTLKAHYYQAVAECDLNPANPNNYTDVRFVRDTMAGDLEKTCQPKNGRSLSFIPRSQFGNTAAARQMNLLPALLDAGQVAANTTGLQSDQIGTPSEFYFTRNKRKHASEADISYHEGNLIPGVHLLRELKIRDINGKITEFKLWFR